MSNNDKKPSQLFAAQAERITAAVAKFTVLIGIAECCPSVVGTTTHIGDAIALARSYSQRTGKDTVIHDSDNKTVAQTETVHTVKVLYTRNVA